ncbi:MAG: DNA polymerase III subunit delta [Rhodocyclaceae bacterium]
MPELRPEQLQAHLARTLAPLYVLHGDEPLLVIEAADAIRAAARAAGFAEREVLVAAPGFQWDALDLAAGNLSLFGARKLIDLRLPGGKPGREGAEALIRHCSRLGEGLLTLISLPQLDWTQRKSAWFQALQRAGIAVELDAPELERLPAWIDERLRRQGQSASAEALEFIAAQVEGNLLAAHQEIRKLALLYPAGALDLAQVEDAVLNVARYDVEKLRMALAEGAGARCARLLDGLRAEGAAPPLVLWSFATEIRMLAAVRRAMDRNQPAAAALKQARVFDGRRARALERSARRLTARALAAALSHAARIDRTIKGLRRGDVWDEFLQLALRIAKG